MTAMDDTTLRARAIRITANPGGGGTVEVDGRDITSALRGFTLHADAREVPSLVLDLAPWHDATAVEGFAHVVVGVEAEPDPGPAAAAFLAAIDPATLENTALAGDIPNGSNGLTRAMLGVLIAWAEGRTA